MNRRQKSKQKQQRPAKPASTARQIPLVRRLADFCAGESFASQTQAEPLPYLIKAHQSPLSRRQVGVKQDDSLPDHTRANLALAIQKLNGMLILPGEMFSFWSVVGNPSARRGYRSAPAVAGDTIIPAVGGGLFHLSNLLNWLVLHSPLTVAERHHHERVFFLDDRRRVPFGAGVTVQYSTQDYRFLNETGDTYQISLWLAGSDLCGELGCDAQLLYSYRVEERAHAYVKEDDGYYRCNQIWRSKISRSTNGVLEDELLLTNHFKVLYDPRLIPHSPPDLDRR